MADDGRERLILIAKAKRRRGMAPALEPAPSDATAVGTEEPPEPAGFEEPVAPTPAGEGGWMAMLTKGLNLDRLTANAPGSGRNVLRGFGDILSSPLQAAGQMAQIVAGMPGEIAKRIAAPVLSDEQEDYIATTLPTTLARGAVDVAAEMAKNPKKFLEEDPFGALMTAVDLAQGGTRLMGTSAARNVRLLASRAAGPITRKLGAAPGHRAHRAGH